LPDLVASVSADRLDLKRDKNFKRDRLKIIESVMCKNRGHVITVVVNSLKDIFWSPPGFVSFPVAKNLPVIATVDDGENYVLLFSSKAAWHGHLFERRGGDRLNHNNNDMTSFCLRMF
jgi:hypothetical protein